jgi:hypothetical protein
MGILPFILCQKPDRQGGLVLLRARSDLGEIVRLIIQSLPSLTVGLLTPLTFELSNSDAALIRNRILRYYSVRRHDFERLA